MHLVLAAAGFRPEFGRGKHDVVAMLVDLGALGGQVGEYMGAVIGLYAAAAAARVLWQAGMTGMAVFRRNHPLTHAERRGCLDLAIETKRMIVVFLQHLCNVIGAGGSPCSAPSASGLPAATSSSDIQPASI